MTCNSVCGFDLSDGFSKANGLLFPQYFLTASLDFFKRENKGIMFNEFYTGVDKSRLHNTNIYTIISTGQVVSWLTGHPHMPRLRVRIRSGHIEEVTNNCMDRWKTN